MFVSRRLALGFSVPLAVFACIQLVPFGHDHSAPPDGLRPAWDSPRTRALAERACLDCHSNQTRWPWYSRIAPLSWRIQGHVQEGRSKLNFSAFEASNKDVAEAASEAGEAVTKQEMPPIDYLLAHPEARLSDEERRALAAGLDAMFTASKGAEGRLRTSNDATPVGAVERESEAAEAEEHTRGRR